MRDKKNKLSMCLDWANHLMIVTVLVICPDSIECEDMACEPWALHQATKIIDIPEVRLIKGSEIYGATQVLTGECSKCGTLYSADHECLTENITSEETCNCKVYLNSAIYQKIGQSLWVDRVFSKMECIVSMHQSLHIWNTGIIALA